MCKRPGLCAQCCAIWNEHDCFLKSPVSISRWLELACHTLTLPVLYFSIPSSWGCWSGVGLLCTPGLRALIVRKIWLGLGRGWLSFVFCKVLWLRISLFLVLIIYTNLRTASKNVRLARGLLVGLFLEPSKVNSIILLVAVRKLIGLQFCVSVLGLRQHDHFGVLPVVERSNTVRAYSSRSVRVFGHSY